ncbi:MAG: hypothetical protein ACTHLJ_16045 [Angustibacter sp.]
MPSSLLLPRVARRTRRDAYRLLEAVPEGFLARVLRAATVGPAADDP